MADRYQLFVFPGWHFDDWWVAPQVFAAGITARASPNVFGPFARVNDESVSAHARASRHAGLSSWGITHEHDETITAGELAA